MVRRIKNVIFVATTKEWLKCISAELVEQTEFVNNKKLVLQMADLRVLHYLLDKMDYNNYAVVPVYQVISNDIGISVRQISQSISKLRARGFIARCKQARTYMINPKYFYVGPMSDNEEKQEEFDELLQDIV